MGDPEGEIEFPSIKWGELNTPPAWAGEDMLWPDYQGPDLFNLSGSDKDKFSTAPPDVRGKYLTFP